MIYVDSSAFVKLVIAEPESLALASFVSGRSLIASQLARTETLRSVGLRRPEFLPTAIALWNQVTLVSVTDAVLAAASAIAPASVRSLDAIHVATAIELRDEIEQIVTYDLRMVEAATAHGLPVASPL